MIGKVCTSVIPFYDNKLGRKSFKSRPILVINGPRNNDYNVLPISTVSNKRNLDADYDVEIDPLLYPKLNLNKMCYVRGHKLTTVHQTDKIKPISDMKVEYEDLYMRVLELLERFNDEMIDNAL